MIEQKPDELNISDYALLLTCLVNAFAAHNLLGGPQMQLDSKVGTYQITLGHVTVDADSIVWLITQNQRREGKRRLGFKTSAATLHSNYRAIKPGFAPLLLGISEY